MNKKHTFGLKVVTDPHEALLRMVFGGAGGALEACAATLGISHSTLSRQLNEVDGNSVSLRKAAAIEQFMDSDLLAECFAARRGGMFIRLPKLESGAAPAMVAGYAKLICEFAEASKAFSDAMTDGQMNAAEIERFEKEARDVYMAAEQLIQAAKSRLAGAAGATLAVVK